MKKIVAKKKAVVKQRNLQIHQVPVDELKLWENNPRINDDAADKLVVLLKEHGFIDPIIATRDGTVRAGNTRLKAARKLNLKTVPVIYVDFKSKAEAEMYAIANNKASEFAQWDRKKLKEIFGEAGLNDDRNVSRIQRRSGFQEVELEGLRTNKSDDAMRRVMREQAAGTGNPNTAQYWVWCEFTNEDDFRLVFDKLGIKDSDSNELSAKALINAVGLAKLGVHTDRELARGAHKKKAVRK